MATGGTEVELKLALDTHDPLTLFLTRFGQPQSVVTQWNHYYRCTAAPELMVRVRKEVQPSPSEAPFRWVLTVKGKTLSQDQGVFIRKEEEQALCLGSLDFETHEGRMELLLSHALTSWLGGTWNYLGCLKNCRRVFCWQGLDLELDQSFFHDDPMPGWELEVETQTARESLLGVRNLLDEMGVAHHAQTQGKFSRFMASIRQQRS